MKILMCSALALALAAPVAAQKTGAADPTQKASRVPHSGDHAASAAHKAATPATPATPADPDTGTPATPATPATPSASASAAPNDPAAILRTEFPAYDKDSSGALSKEEFSTWLIALKNAAPQQTQLTQAQQSEWLGTAFSDADKDRNSAITLAELTTYLTRGSKG